MAFDKLKDDNEAYARLKIDERLKEAHWRLIDTADEKRNVRLEQTSDKGRLDYLLLDSRGFPLCVLEAKKPSINPLAAKDQARRYAESQNIRFVILSNGEIFYLWDIQSGNPQIITSIPTQESLEQKSSFKREVKAITNEKITREYIALTKNPNLLAEPDYINEKTRDAYCWNNGLRILRDYQLDAIKAVQDAVAAGNDRFLIEMATGLGKTLTAGAIIQMFLRTGNATRILFLVDRLELENQALKNFRDYLKDYNCVIFKQKQHDWRKADVVISTIQTLMTGDKYKAVFSPTDFDFIISDEAHRSIGSNSRAVFEYFVGYKLGLTATPKDYIKNINIEKLKTADPKALERRILLDTYKTFGCESGDPTFRYSLPDGVKNGHLINPLVLDAKTDITTELLSKEGYFAIGVDESGEEITKENVKAKSFEKDFFNENINRQFCKVFLENAELDPITGEVGKSLVFCVSQEHAAKITQILNEFAMIMWPGKYNSDFAVQVTSLVDGAQQMTIDFANNKLNGNSRFREDYETSRTRICVTVGMMTTGYDCSDLMNIVFMRPVFSPTDFVQMKGRGTRKHTFKYIDTDKNTISADKQLFKLFDFFENYKYFEKDFKYDQELMLPKGGAACRVEPPEEPKKKRETLTSGATDNINSLKAHEIKDMRIDIEFWGNVKREISADTDIRKAIDDEDWERAIALVRVRYEDKPKLFPTLDNIRKANRLDRRLGWREILEKIFGIGSPDFPTRDEMLENECDKFISIAKPEPEAALLIKNFIKTYVLDSRFRDIIENKQTAQLNFYPGFSREDYVALGDLKTLLPEYIKDNIILNNYME
ncbi:MAG: DEAD/DEAH box helicase family protein [Alphaproteobacteria bacterium]|nr:DEAD/DEAH box helicase family protein [Alphaproteobacteria bacterium]